MAIRDTYTVTALLDVHAIQAIDDWAESRPTPSYESRRQALQD